jgi:hypothetical protein
MTLRDETVVRILTIGENTQAARVAAETVPSYDVAPAKENSRFKGSDNGHVFTMDGKSVYGRSVALSVLTAISARSCTVAFMPFDRANDDIVSAGDTSMIGDSSEACCCSSPIRAGSSNRIPLDAQFGRWRRFRFSREDPETHIPRRRSGEPAMISYAG